MNNMFWCGLQHLSKLNEIFQISLTWFWDLGPTPRPPVVLITKILERKYGKKEGSKALFRYFIQQNITKVLFFVLYVILLSAN